MLLVDAVRATDFAGNGAVTATLVPGKAYCDAAGGFADHWLIEIMAQAIGAIFGLQNGAGEGKLLKLGYLVAIDEYRLLPGKPPTLGSILEIDVKLIHAFYPIGQYEAVACADGEVVARCVMKFVTDEERSLPSDAS